VAFSSRRVWVLLALVVALGVVFWGAVGFASPKKDAANHKNDGKERTLTVLIKKSRDDAVVDVGDRGLSHGDMRVVNAPLYDESGKHRVGRIDVYCVTTDPAEEPGEKANMAECANTYTLPGGEIDTQSVTAFPKLPAPPPKAIDAITGGTMNYEGARGEADAKTRGKRTFITFHFVE
jgi:Allene oxide cyclase barrel like domain